MSINFGQNTTGFNSPRSSGVRFKSEVPQEEVDGYYIGKIQKEARAAYMTQLKEAAEKAKKNVKTTRQIFLKDWKDIIGGGIKTTVQHPVKTLSSIGKALYEWPIRTYSRVTEGLGLREKDEAIEVPHPTEAALKMIGKEEWIKTPQEPIKIETAAQRTEDLMNSGYGWKTAVLQTGLESLLDLAIVGGLTKQFISKKLSSIATKQSLPIATSEAEGILNISKNASKTAIRKQYIDLAKTAHPDAGGSKAAFTNLNKAYQTLTNERPVLVRTADILTKERKMWGGSVTPAQRPAVQKMLMGGKTSTKPATRSGAGVQTMADIQTGGAKDVSLRSPLPKPEMITGGMMDIKPVRFKSEMPPVTKAIESLSASRPPISKESFSPTFNKLNYQEVGKGAISIYKQPLSQADYVVYKIFKGEEVPAELNYLVADFYKQGDLIIEKAGGEGTQIDLTGMFMKSDKNANKADIFTVKFSPEMGNEESLREFIDLDAIAKVKDYNTLQAGAGIRINITPGDVVRVNEVPIEKPITRGKKKGQVEQLPGFGIVKDVYDNGTMIVQTTKGFIKKQITFEEEPVDMSKLSKLEKSEYNKVMEGKMKGVATTKKITKKKKSVTTEGLPTHTPGGIPIEYRKVSPKRTPKQRTITGNVEEIETPLEQIGLSLGADKEALLKKTKGEAISSEQFKSDMLKELKETEKGQTDLMMLDSLSGKELKAVEEEALMAINKEIKGEVTDLFKAIKIAGGIKSYRAGFLSEELNQIPLYLRNNKTGLPLDEIRDDLKRYGYAYDTDSDLLDAIVNYQAQRGVANPGAILEDILKVKDGFFKILDVEKPYKDVGAPLTGINIKNFISKRVAGEEKTLQAIQKFKGMGLTRSDYTELAFIAERPGLFGKLEPAIRKKYSPAYQNIRKFFDGYLTKLQSRGRLESPWPQSHIKRLEERNLHLMESINKGTNPERVAKLKKELENNRALITKYEKGKIQYVHLPVKLWLGDTMEALPSDVADKVISSIPYGIYGRETPTLADLVLALEKEGVMKRADVDIRDIMAVYGRYIENKFALQDIMEMAKKEGMAELTVDAPPEWVNLPTKIAPEFKGYSLHPAFEEYLEKYMADLSRSGSGIGRVMASVKMLQFYNPIFLPMYDVVQSAMAGALLTPKMPRSLIKAIKSLKNKDDEYWIAYNNGLFSQPFSNPFSAYMKDVSRLKSKLDSDGSMMLGLLEKTNFYKQNPQKVLSSIYTASWNIAWTGDKLIRMMTYNHLRSKGIGRLESAQTAALFHGDYASVPPMTRRIMNKVFFTPTFKVVMAKLYGTMIKGLWKSYLSKPGKYIDMIKKGEIWTKANPLTADKVFGRGLAITVGIIMGKDLMMTKGFGFRRDQYCRRYYKKADVDGQPKELVMTFSSPANLPLRYYYRIKSGLMPYNTNKIASLASTFKWDLHPLHQLVIEIASNQRTDFEPVYNPNDPAPKQIGDMFWYSMRRIIRVSELVMSEPRAGDKGKITKELAEELGTFWTMVLRPITFLYMRNTKEQRVSGQIYSLQQEFSNNIKKFGQTANQKDFQLWLKTYDSRLNDLYNQLNE